MYLLASTRTTVQQVALTLDAECNRQHKDSDLESDGLYLGKVRIRLFVKSCEAMADEVNTGRYTQPVDFIYY